MTDEPDRPTHPADAEPLHPLDELASAHLDGVADPLDVAAGSGLPGFTDRVARFEQIRGAVRAEGTPVDADRREAAIAAALAEFDRQPVIDAPRALPDDAPTSEAAAAVGAVVPIEVAKARRRVPGRRWQVVAVAAAVAAGALALVPVLTKDDARKDTTNLAISSDAERAKDADGGDAASADAAAGTIEASPTYATPKIGDFKDYDELAGAVREVLAPAPLASSAPASPTTVTTAPNTTTSAVPPAASTTGGAAADQSTLAACTTPGATTSAGGNHDVVYGGEATVDGHPYTVDVTQDDAGNRTMTVRDPSSCNVVDERNL